MTDKKNSTKNFAEDSLYRDKEGEQAERDANKCEDSAYSEWKEPAIMYTNDFEDIGDLYIAGWELFENVITGWTKKDFKRIEKNLRTELKNQK